MPRNFSPQARAAMVALTTPEAFIALVRVTYPPTGELYHGCMNTEAIVSRGVTYAPYAFTITLPVESGDEAPAMQFDLDNTDRVLVDLLRRAVVPPVVRFEIVLASNPDVVELTHDDLLLREVTWNASTISARLTQDDFLNQRFPRDVYDPVQFPGIF